jgi:hypothetical protein
MNLQAVLQKTGKGAEEIATRKYKLEQKLRTILIVVNGKATGAELAQKFEAIGDVRPMIEQLLAGGFIQEAPGSAAAAPGGAEFKEARTELSHALTDAMGPAGDAITLQLEECKNLEQLRAFVESRRGSLEGALGVRAAKFFAKAKELLG